MPDVIPLFAVAWNWNRARLAGTEIREQVKPSNLNSAIQTV
jgi:hypothetical protein